MNAIQIAATIAGFILFVAVVFYALKEPKKSEDGSLKRIMNGNGYRVKAPRTIKELIDDDYLAPEHHPKPPKKK